MSKKQKEIIVTNYRLAWIKFKKSPDYKTVSERLKEKGIKQPYRDSIIQMIFSQGWWSTDPQITFKKL